jgi:L-threonylcarbamoyladenylate synthase
MKMLRILRLNPDAPDPSVILEAARVIKSGELVVYPTETVYGLGADTRNEKAVAKVFVAKNRPLESPLSVAVDSIEMAKEVARISPAAEKILRKFTPGPLTIVSEAKDGISDLLTSGSGKIGVRVPDHLVALALIKSVGGPITSTSANLSGKPAPCAIAEAIEQLGEHVNLVLDTGKCRLGVPSTVLDASSEKIKVLRKGSIPLLEIESVIGALEK